MSIGATHEHVHDESRTMDALSASTCYAIDMGPTIIWLLPWRPHGGAEGLCAYVDEKGGGCTRAVVRTDTARFLVQHGTASELKAHHSPAWTLPSTEFPAEPATIDEVLV